MITEILDDTGASMARRVWQHASGARVYECCEREDDGTDRTRYQVIAAGGDCLGHHGSLALAAMACDGATPQQLADAAHGEAAHARSAARDAQAWADRGPTEHGYWYEGQAGRTWRSVCMTKYGSDGRPG